MSSSLSRVETSRIRVPRTFRPRREQFRTSVDSFDDAPPTPLTHPQLEPLSHHAYRRDNLARIHLREVPLCMRTDLGLVGDTAAATTAIAASPELIMIAPAAARSPESGVRGLSPSAARAFRSSFESIEGRPDRCNTVEEGPDGKKRSSGVDDGFSTGIPGKVTDKVTDVRAGAENTGDEVREGSVDGEPGSGWLSFEPTTWPESGLPEPVEARYSGAPPVSSCTASSTRRAPRAGDRPAAVART
ncbi:MULTISPECIES: hypothetical protein [unclassified Streptomyces]|uniref:hypothetical protein n=1 Tax=unclassified Streptomyces TaxID=2593676 RepID=UPI0036FFEC9D